LKYREKKGHWLLLGVNPDGRYWGHPGLNNFMPSQEIWRGDRPNLGHLSLAELTSAQREIKMDEQLDITTIPIDNHNTLLTCALLWPQDIILPIIFIGVAMRKSGPDIFSCFGLVFRPMLFHLVTSSHHICLTSDQVIKRTAILIGIARVMVHYATNGRKKLWKHREIFPHFRISYSVPAGQIGR